MNDGSAPATPDVFGERLSRWFDWTHAISLSAVLDSSSTPSSTSTAGRMGVSIAASVAAEDREYRHVRASLATLIAQARSFRGAASAPGASHEDENDFPSLRRRYQSWQQTMDARIGPLRRRVRTALAASTALVRLAELDAVMEEVVGARERMLLASVPAVLEKHFERLRTAEDDRFGDDMQELALAELDLRLQPVQGLLDALRKSSPASP